MVGQCAHQENTAEVRVGHLRTRHFVVVVRIWHGDVDQIQDVVQGMSLAQLNMPPYTTIQSHASGRAYHETVVRNDKASKEFRKRAHDQPMHRLEYAPHRCHRCIPRLGRS